MIVEFQIDNNDVIILKNGMFLTVYLQNIVIFFEHVDLYSSFGNLIGCVYIFIFMR